MIAAVARTRMPYRIAEFLVVFPPLRRLFVGILTIDNANIIRFNNNAFVGFDICELWDVGRRDEADFVSIHVNLF